MRLHIKNMVCERCIASVKEALAEADVDYADVDLGYADTEEDTLTEVQSDRVRNALERRGFELIGDKNRQIIEAVKTYIIKSIRNGDGQQHRLSAELAEVTSMEYKRLSGIFSSHENRTIENFYLSQKTEFVKELLEYGELTVSEIAHRCGYSSVAHLSRSFRQMTGMTPTEYRERQGRRPLDQV